MIANKMISTGIPIRRMRELRVPGSIARAVLYYCATCRQNYKVATNGRGDRPGGGRKPGEFLKAQPKKKKVKKLTVTKVQDAVNKAIRERDEYCMIGDGRHPCKGILTASHYYAVGGNSTFRFYPPNIHAQCLSHHGIHERRQEPFFYRRWMQEHSDDLGS